MDPIVFFIILISSVLVALAGAFFFFDWFGILKLKQSNAERIQKFKRLANLSETFPKERQACQVIFEKVNVLESSWLLPDEEWDIYGNANNFLSNIAASYYPKSKTPILEVRVGKVNFES
jgi:hypothetical protein